MQVQQQGQSETAVEARISPTEPSGQGDGSSADAGREDSDSFHKSGVTVAGDVIINLTQQAVLLTLPSLATSKWAPMVLTSCPPSAHVSGTEKVRGVIRRWALSTRFL